MARGTGAPTTTTERPSARRTATSAGSTRSHRPGRSSPTSHRPSAPRRRWSRYTGSAGWMFRVALESILGFRVENGDTIVVRPCVPDAWPGYRIAYRTVTGTVYEIGVKNPLGRAARVAAVELDGRSVECRHGQACIPLS